MICCVVFCISAGPCSITVKGKITCSDYYYPSGPIYIRIINLDTSEYFNTSIQNLNDKDDYEFLLPIEWLNNKVKVFASWDHDNYEIPGCYMSIGDYWGYHGGGFGSEFQLKLVNNNIHIELNDKLTASVSGEVTCDEFTSGCIGVSVWSCEGFGDINCLVGAVGCSGITAPGSYTTLVSNVEPGNPVWVLGGWYVESPCVGPFRSGDYWGTPDNPITLEEETTGIDFDACQEEVE